jgi:hypothetical protein
MANKQITDLTAHSGGVDDTFNLWIQRDGGGAGSSFAASWSQLFHQKDGVSVADFKIIAANDTAPAGLGSSLILYAGDGYAAGNFVVYAGYGEDVGGDIRLNLGVGGNDYGFFQIINLQTTNPGGTDRVWRDSGVLKIT